MRCVEEVGDEEVVEVSGPKKKSQWAIFALKSGLNASTLLKIRVKWSPGWLLLL